MGQKAGRPRASKRRRTFWTNLRIANDLTLKDLCEIVDVEYSTLGKVLTGELMPSTALITKLCKLFNVPLEDGIKESKKAHLAWESPSKLRTTEELEKEEAAQEALAVKSVPDEKTDSSDILREIYKKISYDDFMLIQKSGVTSEEALKILYDAVDFDTFMNLVQNKEGGKC